MISPGPLRVLPAAALSPCPHMAPSVYGFLLWVLLTRTQSCQIQALLRSRCRKAPSLPPCCILMICLCEGSVSKLVTLGVSGSTYESGEGGTVQPRPVNCMQTFHLISCNVPSTPHGPGQSWTSVSRGLQCSRKTESPWWFVPSQRSPDPGESKSGVRGDFSQCCCAVQGAAPIAPESVLVDS